MIKRLTISFLFFCLIVATVKASIINPQSFNTYFESGGFNLQLERDRLFNITMTSGVLNSSESYLTWSSNQQKGYFIFNSSENGVLTIEFEGVKVTTQRNDGDLVGHATGSIYSFSINDLVAIFFRWEIYDPFEHFTQSGIGLGGIVLTCFGAFWVARKIREGIDTDTLFSGGIGFVLCLIGLALIVVWLW